MKYTRNGTASISLFTKPLGEWRYVEALERRTKADWVQQMKSLLINSIRMQIRLYW